MKLRHFLSRLIKNRGENFKMLAIVFENSEKISLTKFRGKNLLNCLGRRGVFRPDAASQKRFSWFPDLIQKVQRKVNLLDLVKSFPTSM